MKVILNSSILGGTTTAKCDIVDDQIHAIQTMANEVMAETDKALFMVFNNTLINTLFDEKEFDALYKLMTRWSNTNKMLFKIAERFKYWINDNDETTPIVFQPSPSFHVFLKEFLGLSFGDKTTVGLSFSDGKDFHKLIRSLDYERDFIAYNCYSGVTTLRETGVVYKTVEVRYISAREGLPRALRGLSDVVKDYLLNLGDYLCRPVNTGYSSNVTYRARLANTIAYNLCAEQDEWLDPYDIGALLDDKDHAYIEERCDAHRTLLRLFLTLKSQCSQEVPFTKAYLFKPTSLTTKILRREDDSAFTISASALNEILECYQEVIEPSNNTQINSTFFTKYGWITDNPKARSRKVDHHAALLAVIVNHNVSLRKGK